MKRLAPTLLFFLLGLTPPVFADPPAPILHLGNDVEQTVTSWPVFVLIGGGLVALGTHEEDAAVQHFFNRHDFLGSGNKILDVAGQLYVLDSAALLTYAIGAWSGHNRIKTTGETLVEALILTEATTGALKIAVDRTRPNGGSHSFPSGHTSRSFAIATVLQTLYDWPVGIPAYLVAGLIATSRLENNAHYFSDVIFGAALGSAIGWGTARFHQTNSQWAILPFTSSGIGCSVVRLF